MAMFWLTRSSLLAFGRKFGCFIACCRSTALPQQDGLADGLVPWAWSRLGTRLLPGLPLPVPVPYCCWCSLHSNLYTHIIPSVWHSALQQLHAPRRLSDQSPAHLPAGSLHNRHHHCYRSRFQFLPPRCPRQPPGSPSRSDSLAARRTTCTN